MRKSSKVIALILAVLFWLFFIHTSNLYAQVGFSTGLSQGKLIVVVDVTKLAKKTILSNVRIDVNFYDSSDRHVGIASYSYAEWEFPVFESGNQYQMNLPHEYDSAVLAKGKLTGEIGPPGKASFPGTSVSINSVSELGTDTNTKRSTPQRSSWTGKTTDLVDIVNVSSGRQYIKGKLHTGSTVYTDREYKFTDVPSFLEGGIYIITANEDKFSKSKDFLVLNIKQEAIIYIAHDDRYTNKPSWLKEYTPTRYNLIFHDGNRKVTLSLYARLVSSGQIILGGNITPMERGNNGMYTVIVGKHKR